MQWQQQPKEARGVICAADENQEWLLPWWWERYSAHNSLPVTFFDFGMSASARQWCQERGDLSSLDLDTSFVAPRSAIEEELAQDWEKTYGQGVWEARKSWFKKPFAFLNTPYQTTVWLDLDCEVLGSLEPFFSHCNAHSPLGLVREFYSDHLPRFDAGVRYNSGVVLFEHGAQALELLARESLLQNHKLWSDDLLLAHLIHEHRIDIVELPPEYNWRLARGFTLNAIVMHWVGAGGKAYIREKGGFKPVIDAFYEIKKDGLK